MRGSTPAGAFAIDVAVLAVSLLPHPDAAGQPGPGVHQLPGPPRQRERVGIVRPEEALVPAPHLDHHRQLPHHGPHLLGGGFVGFAVMRQKDRVGAPASGRTHRHTRLDAERPRLRGRRRHHLSAAARVPVAAHHDRQAPQSGRRKISTAAMNWSRSRHRIQANTGIERSAGGDSVADHDDGLAQRAPESISTSALPKSANGYVAPICGLTPPAAPTEILARQHYESFLQYFKVSKLPFDTKIGLLTRTFHEFAGEKIAAKNFLQKLSSGDIRITIGTHAVFQKKVNFKNLALVIVDEQHRFGVRAEGEFAIHSQTSMDSAFIINERHPHPPHPGALHIQRS